MKSSDLKVVAIILSIALFFTIITSNAVSIASVVILAKGGTPAAGNVAGGGTVSGTTDGTVGGTTDGVVGGTTGDTTGTLGGTTGTVGGTTGTVGGTTGTVGGAAGTGTTGTAGGATGNAGGAAGSTGGNAQQGSAAGNAQQGGTTGNAGGSTAGKPAGGNQGGAAQQPGQTKSAKECLDIYTTVMNKAKAEKPGYTKVEYQELPSDANNRVISEGQNSVGRLLGLVDSLGVMTSPEDAKANPEINDKGTDMRWFPVYKCEKGCYLTDVNAIQSHSYEDLGGGIARVTIVLKAEQNPEPMAEGASTSPSNTGAMFSPLSRADIDNTINDGVVQAVIKDVTYNLNYHDCKAVIEYNTKTNQLVKVEQYMNVAIQGGGKILGISQITIDKQELFNTILITDFKY